MRGAAYVLFSAATSEVLRVAYVGGTTEESGQFYEGFHHFSTTLAGQNWLVDGVATTMSVYDFDTGGNSAAVPGVFDKIDAGQDAAGNAVGQFHAVIAGTASTNADIMDEAATLNIPNVHCSGGNPTMWGSHDDAFGMHLPFTTYSRGPLSVAKLKGMKTAVLLRSSEHGFARASLIAALQWARERGYVVVGPSAAWCGRPENAGGATSCRIVSGHCRCGTQDEVDAFANAGVSYQVEDISTFYEVNETDTMDGVQSAPTPSATEKFKAVWEDAVAQAAAMGYGPPDVAVNWAWMWHSALQGMKEANYSPKVLVGWQGGTTEDWAEAIGLNGANNTTWHDGVRGRNFAINFLIRFGDVFWCSKHHPNRFSYSQLCVYWPTTCLRVQRDTLCIRHSVFFLRDKSHSICFSHGHFVSFYRKEVP